MNGKKSSLTTTVTYMFVIAFSARPLLQYSSPGDHGVYTAVQVSDLENVHAKVTVQAPVVRESVGGLTVTGDTGL
ncbi:hypothetical protein DPMN_083592 [Dreissena polymorpha]|uniref:Uncharacterized protein n=1 Tax=Dreissena polymorpha TaxID=45954 RepID=A0A9D4BIL6_DREPO|nr:hypothetical protein DPMN_083592 [Dreissena polymorpha]